MTIEPIASDADLESFLTRSKTQPVFLFKHSTSCGISTFADAEYRKFADACENENVVFTQLDLLAHRDISAAIAERTGVEHQSPQAILLVDGKPIWDASHTGINMNSLTDAVAEHCG
jgi:bacillithiol system protein YtxJ